MKPQSAIQKGKDLENYIARRIAESGLDRQAMRMPGSGSGKWKGDINTKMKVLGQQAVIEAKNQKIIKIQEWWAQTERQTLNYGFPILVFKLSNKRYESSKAVIYWDSLLELIKRSQEPRTIDPDKDLSREINTLKWQMNNVKESIKRIENRLK